MTDKVSLIKAEIERLYNQSLADEDRQAGRGLELSANVSYGKSIACKELLSFIDSLPEEPVSKDLEEAADKMMPSKYCWSGDGETTLYTREQMKDYFKTGAQWQKEQMMKTAVDGKIYETQARSKLKAATTGKISSLKHSVGDKVKLIILKED